VTNLTKCGYCCDLCKAYAPNILKNDQRKGLSEMWRSCYNVDIPIEDIYCEGCKCQKQGAKIIDADCPVRECDINKELSHCGQCSTYPCNKFNQRKGLSVAEAQEILKSDYDGSKYNEYLLAYDNKTRINELKKKG
jgi:hypothetical protein